MKKIYNLAMHLYKGGIRVAAMRHKKATLMHKGQEQVFTYLQENRKASDRYVWFHAASLGEFEQGRPVIEAMKKADPTVKIALTFFSPSGYEVRKNYAEADLICYLPIDTASNARQFIDLLRPEKVFFIKYEFWANYLRELHERKIPIYLFSAIFRKEQIFFKPYGAFFRSLLNYFSMLFVQDQESKQLLSQIGVSHVCVTGDTRFDRVVEIQQQAKSLPKIKALLGDARFTIVAGSSWAPDEEILINYFNETPQAKLILVPHEIDEEHIEAIMRRIKRPFIRYTQLEKASEPLQADCLIVDCIGLLSSIYQFADVTYIGGGFGVGIHNTLEAAVYGVPVVFGPNYQRFREARELIACQGAVSIDSGDALKKILDLWLESGDRRQQAGQAAGGYVASQIGATTKILANIQKK